MRIADLEARTGLSRHTLRYYERLGLLGQVERSANNYRTYSERTVERVGRIRRMRKLGFSLQEVADLEQAIERGEVDCQQGAALMAEKRLQVDAQLRDLRALRKELLRKEQELMASWRKHGAAQPAGAG